MFWNELSHINLGLAVFLAICGLLATLVTSVISYIFIKNQLSKQNEELNARTIQAYKDNKEAQDIDISRLRADIDDIKKVQLQKETVSLKEISDLKIRVADLEKEKATIVNAYTIKPYEDLSRKMDDMAAENAAKGAVMLAKYDKIFNDLITNQKSYITGLSTQGSIMNDISKFLTKNNTILSMIEAKLTTNTVTVNNGGIT